MEVLVKILQFLLSLSLLVMLHELGHFCMAKLFKVRVEKFYIFFNPWFSLFRFKKGETEYGVGWVPLGGYVKISGMIDESMDLEQMKQPAQPYEFRSKPAWQRMLIMLGGVLVNFVLAFVIYIAVLFAWGESYLPTANLKYGVVCDSLFHSVGVRNGDKILSVDNKEVERFSDVLSTILLDEAKTMQVMRDGRVVNIDLPESLVRGLLLASSKGYDVEAPLSPRFRYDGVVADIPPESPAAAAGLRKGDRLLALAQLAHAVVLLSEVREVEKRREGADHHLRLVVRELVDELDRVTERRRTGRIGDGHTLVIDRLVGGVGAGVALVCVDYAVEKLVE